MKPKPEKELEFLDVNGVGQMLDRTPTAIRNLCLRRSIPFRKVAGKLIFIKAEIVEWVMNAPGVRLEDIEGS
jgi:hypothetical protein